MKYVLGLILFLIAVIIWGYTRHDSVAETAVLQSGNSAVKALDGTAEALVRMCNQAKLRSKMGVQDQQDCEDRIHDQEQGCLAQVADKWPDAIEDTSELKEISTFYGLCLIAR